MHEKGKITIIIENHHEFLNFYLTEMHWSIKPAFSKNYPFLSFLYMNEELNTSVSTESDLRLLSIQGSEKLTSKELREAIEVF